MKCRSGVSGDQAGLCCAYVDEEIRIDALPDEVAAAGVAHHLRPDSHSRGEQG
jgi:hypothetical protein